MTTFKTLNWLGGKSSKALQNGARIAKLLGNETKCTYVEPFGGMCGILLRRPRSHNEVINDLDGLVYNWWSVVRDQPDELLQKLEATPDHSRILYKECLELLEQPIQCPVTHAWALAVVQTSSYMSLRTANSWGVALSLTGSPTPLLGASHIAALTRRMKRVQLECCDAIKLLEKTANKPDCLIYCDPPYANTLTGPYRATVSHTDLADILLAQKGRVACSGYPGQMPKLEEFEWDVHTFQTSMSVPQSRKHGDIKRAERTECLWMNYRMDEPELFDCG